MNLRNFHLSSRLRSLAGMVDRGYAVCDVGCDHGYVGIYLVGDGISPRALLMDVREDAVLKARGNAERFGLSDRITARISDGLTNYVPGELGKKTALICAGMGGYLIRHILEHEPEKAHDFDELILSPQSDVPMTRRFLRETHYMISDEDLVLSSGIFYPVIKAVSSDEMQNFSADDTELMDILGPVLIKKRHPLLKAYLKMYVTKTENILSQIKNSASSPESMKKARKLEATLSILSRAGK